MNHQYKIKKILLPLFLVLAAVFLSALWIKNVFNPNNAELSVIIPVYNVSQYLPGCLDSLTNQTFNDMEIICVNDGSKDNSLEILNSYSQKDNRIIVIDKENAGVSSARNTGIKLSHGKYLAFVDPDDYIDTCAYEKCMDKLNKTNADVLVFDYIIEPGNKQPIKLSDKEYSDPFEAISDPDINTGFVWNKIFRRSTVVENNIWFKEDLSYAEDNLFVNMVLTKSKLTTTSPAVFYHYQYHGDSSGNSVPTEKQLSNAIKRCGYIIDYYESEGYTHRNKWLLDYCICITYDYIKELTDPGKQKCYSQELLHILDGKLLPKMEEIPGSVRPKIDELRNFASL